MDLKSMLNDSGGHRPAGPPRLHTPQSSYDARNEYTPGSDVSSARPTPYGGPPSSISSRAQGGASGGAGGSYFATQSPHPNMSASASTPSVGPHSAYAQSPGPNGPPFTPRDSHPPSLPNNHSFASPSSSVHHPPTPGSAHPRPHGQYAHVPQGQPYTQFQSPPPPHPNGLPPSAGRQASPNSIHHNTPATPLGPPLSYTKSSPHVQRPPSQGHEHLYRRSSYSSVGSTHSRDYNHHNIPSVETVARESIARSYSQDIREREQSMSVSPKTIPKPSPYREQSISSHGGSHGRPSLPHSESYSAQHQIGHSQQVGPQVNQTPPALLQQSSSMAQPIPYPQEHQSIPHRSPISERSQSHTARQESQVKEEQFAEPQPIAPVNTRMTTSPSAEFQPLKRSASHMDDSPVRNQPPMKRPKRHEIPHWAHSARPKPPRFIQGRPVQKGAHQRPLHPQPRPSATPAAPSPAPQSRPALMSNGSHQQPPPTQQQGPPQLQQQSLSLQTGPRAREHVSENDPPWHERSIGNVLPFEDLTRMVCDWMRHYIQKTELPEHSTFEIEAKIGEIRDSSTDQRIELPVWTETIFNKDRYPGKTRFVSSMNMGQHKILNEYLNKLVQSRLHERSQGAPLQEIGYSHPVENDEFYELSEEGRAHIPEALQKAMREGVRSKGVRVRRTVDKASGQVSAMIIKTRMADLEILNPVYAFDYRISISIESNIESWLNHSWLRPRTDGGDARNKDRVSYRHLMYQVDLTQVSYEERDNNESKAKEHELEVEVASPAILRELENIHAGEPSVYEHLVRGFVDNVRLLIRQAPDPHHGKGQA